MKKRICSIVLSIILLSTVPGLAHGGKTDSSGGHKDNKNKSGLGYYHYHCGGNPPHLHNNGSCPYSGGSSSYQTTTPQKTVVATPKAMIPNFSVKINGTEINNSSSEYPVLNYNNITYIPLTSDLLTYLDISYDWNNPNGIIVNRTSQAVNKGAFVSAFNNGYSVKGQSKSISKVGKAMIINGTTVDSSQYPIINFAGVNYLPLTTDVLDNLGLKSSWSEYEGFSLYN
ncbi:hypothetical protein [Acetoanaerobium noterae]|uniref:hypothetical protein n=1 Tax=Acetoanaerobium noterae TaxID=745369 RepID=UPI00324263FF